MIAINKNLIKQSNAANQDWWRGATIYNVYLRSFLDTNGDGIGDLPGVITKLEYIASLGVNALWLSPFFKSPMKDFGYDISDLRQVDPIFGSLGDFKDLLEKAHQLDLKVIIDLILNHTSDEHPWFQESRLNRTNPKADWYVWADPNLDGTPPNNWLAELGGSAWQWESRRMQYYKRNFLTCQPDLNFHNREVIEQLLEEVKFWIELGVDGFRLDAAPYYFHDAQLRNNPPVKPGDVPSDDATIRADNPYGMQHHIYDCNQPEVIGFLQRLRTLVDRYPGVVLLGEVATVDSLLTMAEYTSGTDKLHMAYTFSLAHTPLSVSHVKSVLTRLNEPIFEDCWPCWSFGNHDIERVASRLDGDGGLKAVQVLAALMFSIRGSVCIYQGEELGLPEADVQFEYLQDPYGKIFWPEFKGRDGCRTPMPWQSSAVHAGFSKIKPWLPISDTHLALAIDRQNDLVDSTLNFYRRFLRWHKKHRVLQKGAMRFIEMPDPIIAFERTLNQERILAVFNLEDKPMKIQPPTYSKVQPLDGHCFQARFDGEKIYLPGYSAFFAFIRH